MKIPRSEWRDKVFLPNLQQKSNNAAELCSQIISRLNDAFAADLIAQADPSIRPHSGDRRELLRPREAEFVDVSSRTRR